MRHLSVLLLAVALCLPAVQAAYALDADEMFADPAKETRARDLGRKLRCVKCRNQSIFDSNAGIARDMRVLVRERIVAGDTDAEILDYMFDRYGDYVLLEPRASSETLVLWAAPAGFLMLGLGGAAVFLRGRGRGEGLAPSDLSDADRAAARALLAGEDRT